MNIHGIMLTRNDWGILPVSVGHALENHVKILHVLDHGSTDQTPVGLKVLKAAWGERLRVYTVGPEVPFKQAVLTNIIVSIAEDTGAEWIYILDSDEFLLVDEGMSLGEYLSSLSDDVVSVRYEVSNLIAPFDFNRFILDDYLRVEYKARPSAKALLPSPYDAIYEGRATFFDVPFPPKVLFRANRKMWVNDGNHQVTPLPSAKSEISPPELLCAHLTYAGRDFLDNKASHGAQHIRLRRDKSHGWQNQLVYRLSQEKKLDEYWERHSIGPKNDLARKHLRDDRFSKEIEHSILFLRGLFGDSSAPINSAKEAALGNDDVNFGFRIIFNTCEKVDLNWAYRATDDETRRAFARRFTIRKRLVAGLRNALPRQFKVFLDRFLL